MSAIHTKGGRTIVFEIARDVIEAHIQFTTYWQFVIAFDLILAIIGTIMFYSVYMIFRPQLRIRDGNGGDEWIGILMHISKCEATPHGDPCRFKILFRRRSWFFWLDLIKLQKLYYLPPEKQKPAVERQLRRAYITGSAIDWQEHPTKQLQNYYYLRPGEQTKGRYESAKDYIEQGDLYNARTTRSVQLAIQSDSELAARNFHIDTISLQIPGLDIPEIGYGRRKPQ